ncbi:uncharacterized protein C8R40DRAFT_1256268 [Lentinula edodes]|uniref:uncharacterized protein n=1 Tax=Lentinula edodes TaxID=5353 RepID=UPI001E8D4D89|nr:uncharacterized protein C8R40DRAFT_1256268 [Lentinula edodes]KAH7871820.1 hypothetical protein C8R40DRAFT_1256268 [Lentinula edodes]
MESYQSPNTPLRIDTEWLANANSPSTSFSPTGPSGRDVPALRVSTSPTRTSFEKPPPSPRKDTSLKNTSRGNESKKLLAHVLEQIKDRNMPPSVYDALSSAAEISNEKKLGSFIDRAVKRRDAGKDRKAALYADDESEDEDERVFSTDTTLELMTRLRELLIISASQGWRIFDDGISQDPYMQRTSSGGRFSSPFRRSLQPGGKRSRSPSPDPKARDTTSTGLLTQCISAIASVVSEDCRFQIASPSPSRPPYALQAVTLEVAQFLLHTYRRASEIVSQIVFALIPAFSTFPREMHARLLAFFEECVTRNALEELSLIQGVRGLKSAQGPRQQIEEQNETVVSIRVDEAFDDPLSPGTSEWTPWTRIGAQLVSLRSTNSPFQSPSTYDYASFFSPLLAAILENIDFVRSRVEVLQRLYRLLDAIITLKLDAHLDVLEIIAYHTPNARRSATCLLTTFWPKAVGHVIVSKSPVLRKFLDLQAGTKLPAYETSYHVHQFSPWFFLDLGQSTLDKPECDACTNPVQGFGLFCPFCICTVHFNCYHYPEGNVSINYTSNTDANVTQVAMYRLSPILDRRTVAGAGTVQTQYHNFRLVNTFTLCLCMLCQKPLWGSHTQGLQCTTCHRFSHSACVSTSQVPPCGSIQNNWSCVMIPPSALVQSCVDFYQTLFSLTEQNIKNGGYEDVSIIYSSLSTQLQIINNGLELGSIVLGEGNSSRSQTQEVPLFRLHDLLAWCEHYLSSETLPVSPVISEYLEENHVFRRNLNMMFEWSNLVYIASAIKTTFTPRGPLPLTSEMLSVSALQESSLDPEENNSPFEVVSLAHMRDVLGYEFNVHLDAAAKLLLSHMHHVGLFDRIDLEPKLFLSEAQDTYCSFPLPIGLDESPDVEALFASVEACLSDLDLSVNEVGLLLLCRRLWPSGMASDYALTRLTRSIISWVLSEDKDLATILRDYLARQRALPGVRSASDPLPWPSVPNGRPAPSSSVNNGGDYVASRKALVSRYAIPWLLALHHQNSENYCNILYDICAELVDDETDLPTDLFSEVPDHDVKAHAAQYHDKVLRSLTRLLHNSLTFTVSEKLFVRWLSSLSNSGIISYPIPSLVRLFQRDHQDHRYSIMDKPLPTSESSEFDPWHHILASAETFNGLTNSICWLSVVASSGVDVSVATYFHFANLVESFKLPVSSSLVFMNAIFKSVWLRHAGRQQMQKIISDLHFRLDSEIVQSLKKKEMCHDAVLFIKQSLVTCLLLYGCDREKLQSTDLVTKDDIKDLPHRRILGRESQLLDPIVVDTVLMNALASYVAANVDEVTCIIAKFLNIFITESPTLESHEVDNFILRNGQMMTNCAFKFYDIQSHDISTLRTSFLLRVAVVDTQPLQELLEEWFRPNEDWKLRLSALVKLFRIILDVTSPAFTVEGRQWRSTITEVFYYFFSTLWADEKEELRLAADTFSSNLLPAHFEQISLCWSELLAKSPIADRVKLVSFLIQLRPHFPSWHMVSWESIVEIIAEDQYDQDAGNDGPLSAHLSLYGLSSKEDPVTERSSADSELISLRISIVLLSLDMIAEGIRIDYNDLLRIKQHVAQILGFADVHAIPAANGHSFFVEFGDCKSIPSVAYPCISHLFVLLDAHHPLLITDAELQGFVNDRAWPLLVGSPYVDILLHLFDSEIHELPGLTLKSLLESLGVIIYKHNIENVYLRHLQPQLKRAVSRVQEIMLKDIDYECRQVALSVLQSYIKKYQGSLRSFVHFAIEQVAKLVVSQSHLNQDPLVLQAKAFIDSMLTAYCNNGIFIGLIRRQLDRSLFVVLKQVLDANAKESGSQHLLDTILYDTFRRAVETDQNSFQVMLNNLQTFVEVVHHQNYSAETMTFVGQSLTYLTRRISEWSPEVVNPAPLLLIAALLIQHNKAQSRDFLSYTDTVLRAVLTRMLVDGATLSRLVQVTATLYRKGPSVNGEPSNNIIPVIFEILNEGLRVKARVLSGTINSMLETVMSTNINGSTTPALSHSNLFVGLALPGIHFLYNYSWTDHRTDNDFQASLTVAKVLLRVSSKDPDILMKFVDVSTEKTGPQNTSIRAWNILLLAVLQDSSGESINMIFSHLATFSLVHHAALRPYTTRPGAQIPESAITDINHAYIAIKVWLIVAQIKAARDGAGSTDALIVWNELYSVFESLIHFFEAEFRAGLSSTLAMLTWSTVADLFLFLRHLPSPVVLHTSSQISLLERLKPLGRGEAHTGKLARTIRSMAEKPLDMPFETMSNQVANDIVAAEKLRILEALNREVIPERRGARTQITLDSNR